MTELDRPPVLEATGEFLMRRQLEYRDLRVLVAGDAPELLSEAQVTQTFAFDVQPNLDLAAALLQKLGHSVVLVPLGDDQAAAMQLLERINEIRPGASKVVLGSPSDPTGMFQAVQRGVVDYLLPAGTSRAELEIILASAIERSVRDGAAADLLTEVSREREELATKLERQSQALYEASSRLDRMNVADASTGLYGHSYFRNTWRREMARSTRYGRPLALMVLDLDRGAEGDDPSDAALRATGSFLLESIRDVDFVARFRSEGFAVILPECNKNDALELAERLRERFAAANDDAAGGELSMTIAVAACPEDESSAPGMVQAADSALRAAMASGGNQVVPA